IDRLMAFLACHVTVERLARQVGHADATVKAALGDVVGSLAGHLACPAPDSPPPVHEGKLRRLPGMAMHPNAADVEAERVARLAADKAACDSWREADRVRQEGVTRDDRRAWLPEDMTAGAKPRAP